LIIKSD